MKKHFLAALCLILSPGFCLATTPSAFVGRWKLDASRSSSILPWDRIALEIVPQGDGLLLRRTFSWTKDRHAEEVILARPDSHTITDNPLQYWVDTWYNNAYIGGDHEQHVKAGWLDRGRILRLDIDLELELQQGDYPVHIYREYRLSADHNTLKVYELRSTRDQPLVFIYTRA